jgi:transposase
MTRPGRYPSELRERAVRLVFEHQGEHPSQWAAITSIAHKFGVSAETLRKWVRRAETDDGLRPGLTSDEHQRLKTLEREVRELRRANEILKSAAASSGRSSTADPADDRLHRPSQGPGRGRADLPAAADRPVHLLRRQTPSTLGPGRARRPAQGRDRPRARRALRRLRRPQGLAAAAPRADHRGPLHRRAADG